ncbi:MAG: tyrosine-type recombinase/integrase [Treponema sp.]|jgi:integrase|nr:tyrosine-type recombinase/integrase [Treponema sp.]
MRRPTLYKQRGTWYARFWNETEKKYHSKALGVPVEGKKERRREAEEAARKMAADMAAGAAPLQAVNAPASAPLIEYALAFWRPDSEYVREKALLEKEPLSAHYLLSNRRMVETKMKPFPGFAGMTLNGLAKPVIRQWKLWMAEKGHSGRTINGAMLALRVPVKRAYFDDLITADPFAGVPRAAHKERARGILTPAEIKKLVETPAPDPRSRLAVFLPLYCSMRMGEVRGLQWGDISDGIIHIRHNWQEGEGLKKCKCGSEGYVPMPRVVAGLVNQVHAIAPLTAPGDFVMSIRPYHPICREALSEALRSELSLIGIGEEQRKKRNIVYHSLRHSFVTACRIAGLSDFETMTLSRHKDVKMLQRYSHGKEALDIRRIGEKLEMSLCDKTPIAE